MNKLILLCVFFFSLQVLVAQNSFILCGKLLNVENGELESEKTIVVNENKIINIFDGYVQPRNKIDKIINLKDKVVMPGLIDMHVHIEQESSTKTRLNKYILNEADIAFNATMYAKSTLLSGFTTVRDLGGSGVNISLKRAIASNKVTGPRILTAGKSLATTGGHADPTNGSSRKLLGDPGPKEGVVNSVSDAKKAVRQRYKNGADWIKITATGGV
ncbi:MAG: amidohydrolase family protein, partial [Vicingaceae bacterium]